MVTIWILFEKTFAVILTLTANTGDIGEDTLGLCVSDIEPFFVFQLIKKKIDKKVKYSK